MEWKEIIEEVKGLEPKIEAFCDTLETAEQVEAFNGITEVLYRMIWEANQQTGRALRAAETAKGNAAFLAFTAVGGSA